MSDDMTIYTDENGRIVRLEDPATRRRINFYGKEKLGELTGTNIERLTSEQLRDLCLNYYVMKVKDGKLTDMDYEERGKVLKSRYAAYMKNEASGIEHKIEEKYGVSVDTV